MKHLTFFSIMLIALCLKGCTHTIMQKRYRIIIKNEIIIEEENTEKRYKKEKDTINRKTDYKLKYYLSNEK